MLHFPPYENLSTPTEVSDGKLIYLLEATDSLSVLRGPDGYVLKTGNGITLIDYAMNVLDGEVIVLV
jgi:hypothetical protein